MSETIHGAPVPPEVESEGREAIARWFETVGRFHKDYIQPPVTPAPTADEEGV